MRAHVRVCARAFDLPCCNLQKGRRILQQHARRIDACAHTCIETLIRIPAEPRKAGEGSLQPLRGELRRRSGRWLGMIPLRPSPCDHTLQLVFLAYLCWLSRLCFGADFGSDNKVTFCNNMRTESSECAHTCIVTLTRIPAAPRRAGWNSLRPLRGALPPRSDG